MLVFLVVNDLAIYVCHKPSKRGIVIDNAGKKVIKKITKISTAKKGRIAFEIASTLSPETLEATNNTNPIGGVASPTVKLTLIITAKCTGSTPKPHADYE